MSGYGSYGSYGSYGYGSYSGDFSSVGGYANGGYTDAAGYSSASNESSVTLFFAGDTTLLNGDDSITTVTVTGARMDLEPVIITFSPVAMGAYSEAGGSGATTTQIGSSLAVSANPTPSLKSLPANVDMTKLNGEAKYIGQVMEDMHRKTGLEYGTIFYTLNGQIYFLPPIQGDSNGHEANLTPLFAELPPGAEVIATEHTHPDEPGTDEREPSNSSTTADLTGANNDVSTIQKIEHGQVLVQGVPVNADPNMITYIVGALNEGPVGIYAYDNNTMVNASVPDSVGTPGARL